MTAAPDPYAFQNFLINWVVSQFNAKYGTTYQNSSFIVVNIPIDQNAKCAYEIYSNDPTILARIRVYMQLGKNTRMEIEKIEQLDQYYTGSVGAQVVIAGRYENVTLVGYNNSLSVTQENTSGQVKTIFLCNAFVGSEIINMGNPIGAYLLLKRKFFNECPQIVGGTGATALGRQSLAKIPVYLGNTIIQLNT